MIHLSIVLLYLYMGSTSIETEVVRCHIMTGEKEALAAAAAEIDQRMAVVCMRTTGKNV